MFCFCNADSTTFLAVVDFLGSNGGITVLLKIFTPPVPFNFCFAKVALSKDLLPIPKAEFIVPANVSLIMLNATNGGE